MLRILSAFAVFWSMSLAQTTRPDNPAFRADTRLVQINVIVRDKNGPASGLTKDDFVLSDRGKSRAIQVFSVDSLPATAAETQAGPAGSFSNHQYGNSGTAGSVTIILLDRLNTLSAAGSEIYEDSLTWYEDHALTFAKQKLMQFVKEMGPRDRIAIYSLGESLSVVCDFTGDRQRIQTLLANYRATSITNRDKAEPAPMHTPVPGDFNQQVDHDRRILANLTNLKRVETTRTALLSIAAHVSDIPGRKNLVWLTANLPFSGAAMAMTVSGANLAIYPVDARGLLPKAPPITEVDLEQASKPALFKTSPAAAQGSELPALDTMQALASETGGRAFFNSNDLAGAIRQAVDDGAVTYTLGFYAGAETLDGKFHELRVRVKRAGLDVRYPKGYFAFQQPPVSDAQAQNSLLGAFRSPLESSAIHLTARVERTDRPQADSLTVTGAIDLRDLHLEPGGDARKGNVDVHLVEQDAAGNVVGQSHDRIALRLSSQQYEAWLKSGVQFRKTVAPKDGVTTLRVVVRDPGNARIGSLIIPLAEIR